MVKFRIKLLEHLFYFLTSKFMNKAKKLRAQLQKTQCQLKAAKAELKELNQKHELFQAQLNQVQTERDTIQSQLQQLQQEAQELADFPAEKLGDEAVRIAEHHSKIGEIYFRKEYWSKAGAYFRKAIALNPNSAWYHQNLGEAIARCGKWDLALSFYRQALKLNPDEVHTYHQSLTIQGEEQSQIQVDNPIFIVGCGHSGTSIMLALLGNHPRLYPIPKESGLFMRSDAEVRQMMQAWDCTCAELGKTRWIEKTPPHIFQIARLLAFRPQSQFILMLRDGRDVVCSLRHRKAYAAFADRVDRWVYDNLAGLPYWDHPQVKVVKYESLIAQPEQTLQDIFNFLGEEYTAQVLEYHNTQRLWYSSEIHKPETIETHQDHMNLRNWQINQPLFDGRGRWREEMTAAEKDWFKSAAQQYLEQFGYVENDDW